MFFTAPFLMSHMSLKYSSMHYEQRNGLYVLLAEQTCTPESENVLWEITGMDLTTSNELQEDEMYFGNTFGH